jgi:hypothetical protein
MSGEIHYPRERYGEAFWRMHHEAWCRSELNQREYCEAQGIPLKAFGNWRAKFKAEPQTPACKVLYRRGRLSHGLSHGLSHDLPMSGPVIPPARGRQPCARPRGFHSRRSATGGRGSKPNRGRRSVSCCTGAAA